LILPQAYVKDVEQLLGKYGGQYLTAPRKSVQYLLFNTKQAPVDDPRVRRALVMAIDIEEYDRVVTDRARAPAVGGFIPPGIPGHSPGQVMFTWPDHAVVGDCLFAGSVGRTDLPGGDFATLVKSVRERIYALPDHTLVHAGHGPDTSVGREKATNPFVSDT